MEIFLVEDSAPIRERLAVMFDGIPGARLVGEAADADAAIREILAIRPDIVVLDLGLAGGTSGFDVLRAVRPQAPEIEFYMLSNFAADPYRQLAARLGARGFFDKSREFERVREAIAGILASEPDIALLDLNLKEGSGFDVLRALGGRMPRTRFYMLSNFSADPYRQLARRLGARDFFDKTKDIERVREIMQGREPCLQSSC